MYVFHGFGKGASKLNTGILKRKMVRKAKIVRSSNGPAAPTNSNVVNSKVSEETRASEEIRPADQMLLDTLGSGQNQGDMLKQWVDRLERRICSSPPNLSTRANLQSVTKSVPGLIIAIFTHDLWPDHYQCLHQLVEDDYATCRRTTLLFVFSAGKVINAMSKWTLSKGQASRLFGFMLPRVCKASSQDACELIGACDQDLSGCDQAAGESLESNVGPEMPFRWDKFAAELIVGWMDEDGWWLSLHFWQVESWSDLCWCNCLYLRSIKYVNYGLVANSHILCEWQIKPYFHLSTIFSAYKKKKNDI